MSHIDPGPLATYESLADPHLTGYFNNSRMRKHLRRMGLITGRGDIVSEKVFRLNNARKEHQRHIRDVLAQAIVHKALDMERHRQMHVKRQLEEIGKIERVRRVRAERALRGDEDILPLLIPQPVNHRKTGKKSEKKVPILQTVTDSSEDYEQRPPPSVGYPALPSGPPYNTRSDRMTTQYPRVEVDNQHLYNLDQDALRSFTLNLSQFDLGSGVSPYMMPPTAEGGTTSKKKPRRRPATATGMPRRPRNQRPRSNARSLRLHRREPSMMHRAQVHTLARVTFKYLGQMVHLDHEEEDPRDEIVVMQQHCGGENLRIYKGMLMKGDKFIVISRRHRAFPFSLTFYLNGVQVERLSTCCEYKHKTGHKLGARSSHFGIIKVEGSQPCFKCLITQGKLKTRPDPTPPPTASRTKPSRPRRKPTKKLQGVDEQKPEVYADDFQGSSKSSTTTEDVQTDGPKVASEASSSEVSSDSSPLTSETESESEDDSSDTESKLPSLRAEDASSTSSTESDDSQRRPDPIKPKKSAAKQERIKSPLVSDKKPKSPPSKRRSRSPPKERVKSPPQERAKTVNKKEEDEPELVTAEVRSPSPIVQKVEKTSSSETSDKEEVKGSLSLSSSTSVSSMSDTGEEAVKEEFQPLQNVMKVERKSPPPERKEVPQEKPSIPFHLEEPEKKLKELPERPPSPEPESPSDSSSESSSSSSDSDSSEVPSVKSKHSTSEELENVAVNENDTSIMPLVKGQKHVDLSKKKLTKSQIEELTKYFDTGFGSLKVEHLDLTSCSVGDDSGKVLFKALLKSKSLKSVDVAGNGLSRNCIDEVLDLCQKSPVEDLSLANNPLKDGGCEYLISGFSKSQAAVVTAKLQKKVSQTLISSVLKDSKKEMADELGSSVSSASSMSSLASSAISETVFLRTLDISYTGAGHVSFEKLGQYLSLNPKLETLNISGNEISTTALELLIKPVGDGSNKNLKSLAMNEMTMDDRHVELFVKLLTGNCNLTELSIKGNRITEEGVRSLEELRTAVRSLDTLKID